MRVLWLLLGVLLLSGCAESAAPNNEPEEFENLETKATDSTGVIRGVVVDATFTPLSAATVAMQDGRETLSDKDGLFVFADLEPGTYFLTATKAGYSTLQVSTDVVAGVDRPPVVKIQLVVDVSSLPFSELLNYNGFLQCGVGLGVTGVYGRGVNPCAFAASINTFDTFVQRPVTYIQAEMIWEPSSGIGDTLSIGIMNETTVVPEDHVQVDGQSPQILKVDGEEMPPAHGEDYRSYLVRVFPGKSQPTVVVEQRFEIFLTQFYDQVPTEDWSFIADGPWRDPTG